MLLNERREALLNFYPKAIVQIMWYFLHNNETGNLDIYCWISE